MILRRLRVLFPRNASEMTKVMTLTARLVKAKVTTCNFSWMVSGWMESKELRRKRMKVME